MDSRCQIRVPYQVHKAVVMWTSVVRFGSPIKSMVQRRAAATGAATTGAALQPRALTPLFAAADSDRGQARPADGSVSATAPTTTRQGQRAQAPHPGRAADRPAVTRASSLAAHWAACAAGCTSTAGAESGASLSDLWPFRDTLSFTGRTSALGASEK